MNDLQKIQSQAKKKYQALQKARNDPRFQNVLGRLLKAGLLQSNFVAPTRTRTTVEDALWAGQFEPRVFELLPGILLRKPKFFLQAKALPSDLLLVLKQLRRGRANIDFRGIPAAKYKFWADQLGKNKRPLAILQSYRFTNTELELIASLRKKWKLTSNIEVLRKALQSV